MPPRAAVFVQQQLSWAGYDENSLNCPAAENGARFLLKNAPSLCHRCERESGGERRRYRNVSA